jgi:hypothetical protein
MVVLIILVVYVVHFVLHIRVLLRVRYVFVVLPVPDALAVRMNEVH